MFGRKEEEETIVKRLAMITARGGSKRIPRKNIRDFCGKPILAYSVEAAIKAEIFDEVMVSTDDPEIAEAAKEAGAHVPFFRSEAASGDFATTAEVIKEVLEEYKKRGRSFETACCIYPTAPFITPEKLKSAVELLEIKGYDSVMPVAEFSFPPLRGMVRKDNRVSYKWPEFSQRRSQDLEKIYHDVGQFYVLHVERFMKTGELITQNTGSVIISELEMQDIDHETDWRLAELKYRMIYGKD